MKKINVVHAFSGVDSQLMAEKRVWGDRVNVLATMEIDIDAIISCGAIHENTKFTEFSNMDFTDSQIKSMKKWLKERNIGYDFEKGKSKVDRMPIKKLKQLFVASRITKNLGDISLANQIKLNEDIDIFTYSSPCQSFSLAGKQEGLKGTSGLLLECEKFIEINKPKVLLLENVKNLVGKKFKGDFDNWVNILDNLGYNTYWKVLNAKHYGVPQNRERVFALSIRKDLDCGYEFPEEIQLNVRLKDILDSEIEDKYYLSEEIVNKFKSKMPSLTSDIKIVGITAPEFRTIGQRDECYPTEGIMETLAVTNYKKPKQIVDKTNKVLQVGNIVDTGNWNNPQRGRIYSKDGISPALNCVGGGGLEPKIVVDSVSLEQPNSQTRRDYDSNKISNTLTTSYNQGEVNNFTIRKLTPSECWKLMDFDCDAFEKVKPYMSDSALYKQAGNSIVVACIEHIFKNLDIDKIMK